MKSTIYRLEIVCLTTTSNAIFSKADTAIKTIFELFGVVGKCEYHIPYDDRTAAARKHEAMTIQKIKAHIIK